MRQIINRIIIQLKAQIEDSQKAFNPHQKGLSGVIVNIVQSLLNGKKLTDKNRGQNKTEAGYPTSVLFRMIKTSES